jgi:hypothetical protein
LDQNEEKEREIKEDNSTKLERVALPIASEYAKEVQKMLDEMDESDNQVLSLINKDAKSMFKNKRALKYIARLIEYNRQVARTSVVAYFGTDYTNRKLNMLEEVITTLIQYITSLPQPEDMKKLKDFSQQMAELDVLMKKLKELEDQAEQEKAEAFKRIDKVRQQVLKDVIV